MTELQTVTTLLVLSTDLFSQDSNVHSDNQTEYFSQLLFNVPDSQLVVGARDNILRLSIYSLQVLERAVWPPSEYNTNQCQLKGRTERECHNYIKVMLRYKSKMFICGTNAFAPICSWRYISSINNSSKEVSGLVLCPFDPQSNATALLSRAGEYYAGTPVDFTGTNSAISRTRGASEFNSSMLLTPLQESWLIDPQFVLSFEDDLHVYFVFREIATEFVNLEKVVYSRIGRVCMNDAGAIRMRDTWSTLQKARLSCSVPGYVTFYYDEVHSAEYVPQEELLVATFSTPENGVPGSAICTYKMSDIRAVFNGSYNVWNPCSWEAKKSDAAKKHFSCMGNVLPHRFRDYSEYMLTYNAVEPINKKPIYRMDLHRFTHLAVDVSNQFHGAKLDLFVATATNEVMKLVVMQQGVFVAEWWNLGEGMKVLTMKLVPETSSVYIGSTSALARIPTSHCHSLSTEASCRETYCNWLQRRCVDNRIDLIGKEFHYTI